MKKQINSTWVLLVICFLVEVVEKASCICSRLDHAEYLTETYDFTNIDFMQAVAQDCSEPHCKAWLQIGANTMGPEADQTEGDVIQNLKGWDKFFLEPIPFVYKELENNVKIWPHSLAIQGAIRIDNNVDEETLQMYCPDLDGETEWLKQICSFSKYHILKHLNGIKPGFQKYYVENVTAYSFKHLVAKFEMKNVNVLVIDVEGFDYSVVYNIPFSSTFRPEVILYEHLHLSQEKKERSRVHLRHHCYASWELPEGNSYGVDIGVLDKYVVDHGLPDGSTIKFPGQKSVFLIEEGMLHEFKNGDDFVALGYDWGNVITIDPHKHLVPKRMGVPVSLQHVKPNN